MFFIINASNKNYKIKSSTPIKAQTYKPDSFERTITPQGTSNHSVLSCAPSPKIKIKGENTNAKIVVDLSTNILYKYDSNGNAEEAFLIASGARRTPTHKGVRIVTHKEYYPYKKEAVRKDILF